MVKMKIICRSVLITLAFIFLISVPLPLFPRTLFGQMRLGTEIPAAKGIDNQDDVQLTGDQGQQGRRGISNYLSYGDTGKRVIDLGGSLQVDYRYYAEEDVRADDRFDIRKARLFMTGAPSRILCFRLEYEFQGSEKNLIDAWGEVAFFKGQFLRFGQFKEPFSLEWQTKDRAIPFAERSMGYSISPKRDVGVMCYGSLLGEYIHYALALFNGDGMDVSEEKSRQRDDHEFAGRIVLKPFMWLPLKYLQSLQIGASGTHARINRSDVSFTVKSTGMVGTDRSIYDFNPSKKFGQLYGADERRRLGLEAAWAFGPLALQGEYSDLIYTNILPSGKPPENADFYAWYGSALLFLTGESPVLKRGSVEVTRPKKEFDRDKGTYGGLCIAFRMEEFKGDQEWIKETYFDSVRKADAYSIALNWLVNDMYTFIVDYTKTRLSGPLLMRRNPEGTTVFIEKEHVLTVRFDISF